MTVAIFFRSVAMSRYQWPLAVEIVFWLWVVGISSSAARSNVLEVVINGLAPRLFTNGSLGLNNEFETQGHQCLSDKKLKFSATTSSGVPKMSFTPNRRTQETTLHDALQQRLKLAVVLAVGGHSDSHYNYGPGGSVNGLMAVWDSWLEYFFSPLSNTTSLVLLFDERDYKRQNISTNKKDYLDTILMKNMGAELADCAHIRARGATGHHGNNHHGHFRGYRNNIVSTQQIVGSNTATTAVSASSPHSSVLGCSADLNIDDGYRVYFIDIPQTNYSRSYTLKGSTGPPTSVDYSHQRPLIIFASVHNFPKPEWAEKEDEDELFRSWKPFRLNKRYPTNYGYVKMTNWYSYFMLRLKLLDFFDYAAKLDNDVSFVAPFPTTNLPLRMATGQHYMLMTTAQWYNDDPRISQGVNQCLTSYLHDEVRYCGLGSEQQLKNTLIEYNHWNQINYNTQNSMLQPGAGNDTTFFERSFNNTFRAHFLVYWLGIYTAPETMNMAKFWNYYHPRGMWDFRWGDQQWWPRPIAMFGSGNLDREILHASELDSDNERYVVHKLWPRQGTVPKAEYYDPKVGTTRAQRDERYQIVSKPLIY